MKASVRSALFVLFAALTFNQAAQAGVLLEPYLGYVSGQTKQASTANFTGTEFGARVGYTTLGFALGVEYAATSFTDDSTPKNDLKGGDLGVFVAFKFPVLVRAYATYFPSSEIKDTASGGIDTTLKSGNVMKLGVGFTGLPFINVNLEYITSSYSKAEAGGISGDLDPKLTGTAYALSISAPFDLL